MYLGGYKEIYHMFSTQRVILKLLGKYTLLKQPSLVESMLGNFENLFPVPDLILICRLALDKSFNCYVFPFNPN